METVKLKDIAEKTGFSISTVSRILSGDPSRKMKDETIEMVLRTADEMGYYKARRNKLRKSIPEIRMISIYMEPEHEGRTVYPLILEGMMEEVKSEQLNTRLDFESFSCADAKLQEKLVAGRYDAAILIGKADARMAELLKSSIPYIIHVGLAPMEDMDDVICDFRDMVRHGYRYLRDSGRKDIAYIGSTDPGSQAHLGFLEGMVTCGDDVSRRIAIDSTATTLDGYESSQMLLDTRMPDAIMTTSDNTAIGVMKALMERRIGCPDEIAVLGCGNLETSAYLDTTLSTYDIPGRELGKASVRIALLRLENPGKEAIRVVLPYRFIERESTRRK